MDEAFKALSDPNRRLLLERLGDRDGQSLQELCTGLAMARQSVSKHLAVLQAANLVTTSRRGREKLHYLNAGPIHAIADRWINRFDRHRMQTVGGFQTDDDFTYTTYIRTTPERLWHAITNPAVSASHLGHAIESDWQKGSSYVWVEQGLRIEHPEQVILESDPYQRLAFTFHTHIPDTDNLAPELTEAAVTSVAAPRRSRVSFDIEPHGEVVKLIVAHGGFGPNSAVRQLVSRDWPIRLSSLKSALEQSAP